MQCRSGIAAAAGAAALGAALAPSAAQAGCLRWDYNISTPVRMSGFPNFYLSLREKDGGLVGHFSFHGEAHFNKSAIRGTIDGAKFQFRHPPQLGPIYRFDGVVLDDGYMMGTMTDVQTGQIRTWKASKALRCPPPIIFIPGPPASPPREEAPAGPGPIIGSARPCKPGYVWRMARPGDTVCVTPETRDRTVRENEVAPSRVDPNGAYGPNSCYPGFVWREAYAGDSVCVRPEIRDQTREDNRLAASRTEP